MCHAVADISTSGLDSHAAISGYPSMTHLLVDTFFEFDVVEIRKLCFYRCRIKVILTSDSFGCELRLWTLDDDLLLLPVLSVVMKM